jgi:hypothetical protein
MYSSEPHSSLCFPEIKCSVFPDVEGLVLKHGYVRFEVFTAVTTKNAVFWDVTPCDSCKNRCLGGTYHIHHQGDKNRLDRNNFSSK